jgi:radical SAM protein with 4Fe4S-binding SPASM domain
MCGRRKWEQIEKTDWGDMDRDLMYKTLRQIPSGIIVQFHSNGEPLLYPLLVQALTFRLDYIRTLDTNGKLLVEQADYIIGHLETITISVIENDPEQDEQYEIVKKFLEIKGDRKPFVVYRLLGDVGKLDSLRPHKELESYGTYTLLADLEVQRKERRERWYKLPGLVAPRILHKAMGSFGYSKKVTIPEHGICLDLLSHLVIDRFGDVYPCVRFNPNKYMKLGNIKETNLIDMWNSPYRLATIEQHIKGNRKCTELCSQCDFYGVPTG